MDSPFESLGHEETPAGPIRLWRRRDPRLDVDVYEVKLGDEYLMTSLFPQSEIALADLGLERVDGDDLRVVVGGLGLGYTANAVLADDRVAELLVVEASPAVIQWHREGLVPGAAELVADPRTRLVEGDFFRLATSPDGFDDDAPGRRFDALLVDIDHTPEHHLDDAHGFFYEPAGLAATMAHVRPDGVFGFWSDGPPIDAFTARLGEVLDAVEAIDVPFDNPLPRGTSHDTVYVGIARGERPDD